MNPLRAIAARAAENGLGFLVAGGHAVILHGYPRNTFDVDLIIRRDDQGQWAQLAQGLGYSLHREGPTFLQFNPSGSQALPLDLMLVNDGTFTKLSVEAVSGPTSAGGARVVSLRHLLALKCHAIKHGHAARVGKDADDVVNLVKANRLDLNDPEIREIFQKHGTPELYAKIQRVCR